MSLPTPDIAQRIRSELTQSLWDRLLLYADEGVEQHRWHGILGGPPLRGKLAEDFVQTAVLKTMKGDRVWQPDRCSLEQHLRGIIDSDINHDSERVENQRVIRERTLECEDSEDGQQALDRFPNEDVSIEKLELEAAWENFILEFLTEITDDQQVQALFEALYDGINKRSDLARHLQIIETQLDAVRKRLATRVKRFQAKKSKTSQKVSNV